MKKRFSIYHFLVAIMMFSLLLPGVANAEASTTGSLTIHKYEQEPGASQGEGDGSAGQIPEGEPLAGVTYKVKQTHSYDGENWTEVTGGQEYELTTDENGQVTQELPLGRYSVGEIDGPDHVNLNPDTFYVDIPMTSKDGSTLTYDVHIYPKNETIRGAVELTKTDGDSGAVLAGVQFELYNTDGTKVEDTIFVTDANGKIKVDGLAFGNYYFKEIATIDGYVLGSQKVDFSITESGTTVKVNVKNYKEPEVDKDVDFDAVNRGEIVTYTITVDLPGDIKDYKNFVVTDTLHENLEFVEVVSQADGFTFNQNGQTLTWTATPSELSGPSTVAFSFKAKVSEDAEANKVIDNKAYIDYENNHGSSGHKETDPVPVTPTAGSLKVIKQDKSTKQRLEGAEFALRDSNGDLVETGTTGANGELVFTSELDYGNYTLHETKAPNGYRKLTKPIEVTIDGENSNVTITVDNSKSGWELPKTGGIGTILFTLIGLTFMGSALYLYIRRRRREFA
ncbi:SpaH/EbpB family LPXTG-anchored major pilin [Pseudogracilibacillus auburnensis]|uniref:LPXTG-motif cell wall-anchored protein/uncharacterized repeat protein (TIGR01451 family)/fimbrial isopeptide formation D2 family protein n=1 Tax=Pseudogracilibacillus auburnensis TaxID=1494959 RepID=A0A2V3VUL1_9BACI|nr:SpaH/EbpB family LPXTG-anchored major pilin [Pseudogracilibacillus auburnensis]MBO1003351.1 SpaH/EbpB family LPXTG-anchored major pilin [Pseudogracilibacillus auburnensis]PXW85346.1 LPXTG-motif cell wall-anchored protein/uncharacterized repeat protein (TIGR01451 family)/fimbrial isopeptide formation D2 family protein [Pseudogracilibacillus auburnensis]